VAAVALVVGVAAATLLVGMAVGVDAGGSVVVWLELFFVFHQIITCSR
jgi:hypothetical protein